MTGLRAIVAGLALAGLATAAAAQDPPYEAQMLRLGEVLGALAYIDRLCTPEGHDWRAEMEALLGAEQPEPARRARLVDRFNLGYASFASVYRNCTPAARLAITRYRSEGADLIAAMRTTYGPPATDLPLSPER